jgi:hypothetical protein
MYTQLDVVGDAETRAEAAALADRLRYKVFIEAAERFAAENGLIVGGAAATRLLLGDPGRPSAPPPLGLDSFQYDFYSGRAPAHARALGDAMYELDPQGLGHYTTVITKVPGSLLAVAVDGRDLFTITALPVHRGVRTAEIVIPTPRPAQFATKGSAPALPLQLACMGPEIQLMGLYTSLCNPGLAGEWSELLATEASLRALFGREIRAKITEAVSRAESPRVGGAARRGAFFRRLYEKYVTGADRVLVGSAAEAILAGRPLRLEDERIQVVSASPLDAEGREIAALAKAEGLEVQMTTNDPRVPTDPRLRRLTVSLTEGRGGRREPILDVYNAAAHELIPYVTAGALGGAQAAGPQALGGRRGKRQHFRREREPSASPQPQSQPQPQPQSQPQPQQSPPRGSAPGWHPPAALKVGTPFVLMRFRLADMWTMQVLMRMGVVNAAYGSSTLHEMLAGYEAAAGLYERILATAAANPESVEAAAAQLLPLSLYVGRFEDPGLALRREALGRAGVRFYPPYLPASRAGRDEASGEAEEPAAEASGPAGEATGQPGA